MSTFRDELVAAALLNYTPSDGEVGEYLQDDIDAVLASEPMQAIRATLLEFAQFSAGDYNDKWAPYRTTTPRHELGDLRECVIDWVMEGNE